MRMARQKTQRTHYTSQTKGNIGMNTYAHCGLIPHIAASSTKPTLER